MLLHPRGLVKASRSTDYYGQDVENHDHSVIGLDRCIGLINYFYGDVGDLYVNVAGRYRSQWNAPELRCLPHTILSVRHNKPVGTDVVVVAKLSFS